MKWFIFSFFFVHQGIFASVLLLLPLPISNVLVQMRTRRSCFCSGFFLYKILHWIFNICICLYQTGHAAYTFSFGNGIALRRYHFTYSPYLFWRSFASLKMEKKQMQRVCNSYRKKIRRKKRMQNSWRILFLNFVLLLNPAHFFFKLKIHWSKAGGNKAPKN